MGDQFMPREQLGVCAEGNLHSVYLMFNANDMFNADVLNFY